MPKSRKNGRVLTVKQLDEIPYNLIHDLPRGYRGDVIKSLLNAAVLFMASSDENWYKRIIAGEVTLVETNHHRRSGKKTRVAAWRLPRSDD